MPTSFNLHHRVSGDPTRSRSSHFIKTRWRRIAVEFGAVSSHIIPDLADFSRPTLPRNSSV